MAYNPAVKLYYISPGDGGPSENNRIVPAPQITVSQEMIYANDTIIGYSFIVSLNGNCTSLDLRNVEPGVVYDFDDTLGSINRLKNIINANGATLLVTDGSGTEILKGLGGTIRNINISESNNQWVNYAPYSIEIEFNDLWFGNCDGLVIKNCGEIFDGLRDSPYLIDMKKYRVKSFTDSFSLDLSDSTMYNSFNLGSLNINNHHFSISYTIQATGKHYFNSNFQLMPAWEQAKRFVQHKLIEQIKNRLTSTLIERASSGCSASKDLASIYAAGSPAFIDGINLGEFKIYNETISCDASEAEGSFSATYNALIKRNNGSIADGSLHTFSKSVETSDSDGKKTTNINISGNIQGLVETGLLKTPNILELPSNGAFLAYNDSSTNSRYSKALAGFNSIATKEDLKQEIKDFFGINNQALNVTGDCVDPNGSPKPSSHTISHSYSEGTISYNTSYGTDIACSPSGTNITNISITTEDDVDIIAEFIIPGRAIGPILQKTGAKTPRKLSINIDGTLTKECCVEFDGDQYDALCAGTIPNISGLPPAEIAGMKITQNQINYNPIDGSYSVSRAYICCDL
jgi:hypothetical protein